MTNKVIGICGLIGSGKDTVGQRLVSEHGYTRLSFAMVLKDVLSVIFGWDREMMDGTSKESRAWRDEVDPWWTEKLGREWSPRIAMQQIGTNLFRNQFHDNMWVNTVENKMRGLDKVVFTDVRFPNEISFIKSLGELWVIEKGDRPEWYDAAVLYNNSDICHQHNMMIEKMTPSETHGVHISEWAWIGAAEVDATINNDDTLDELYKVVDSLI